MMQFAQLTRHSRRPVLLLYAAVTGVILMRAGDPASFVWWGGAVPFMLWIVSPIAFMSLTRQSSVLLPLAALGLAIGSTTIYISAMYGPGASSTSALIFVFIPLYLWIAALIVWGLSFVEYRLRAINDE